MALNTDEDEDVVVPPRHENFRPGVYEHYKGGLYRALFLAKNSTDGVGIGGEPWVVYICLSPPPNHPARPGQVCTRSLKQWNESVTNGMQPRFRFLNG
jgi:hypothetical protein